MKRWILLAILIVGLSGGATLLMDRVEIGDPLPAPVPSGPVGKAVLDGEPVHDFGTMAQESNGERTWVVANGGPGDLVLSLGAKTCSCTIANLAEGESATVKPGESTKIRLTWETRTNRDKFEKSASVLTNDPEHPEIKFVVRGNVQPAITVTPEDARLDFKQVANDEPHVSFVAMASADHPEMKILGYKISNPKLIEVKAVPLTAEDRKGLGYGEGYKLEVSIKPGTILGNFSEEVIVLTDHPRKPELPLRVFGRVVGPISVVPERLKSFAISGPLGGEATASIWVRGREQTVFEVLDNPEHPKMLKVTVTPVETNYLQPIKGRQYRLTASVPPGTPAGVVNGTIVLKTDHPGADRVTIPFELLVSGDR